MTVVILMLATLVGLQAQQPPEDEPTPVAVERPERERTLVDEVLKADDPSFGGWETEALSSAANGRLKSLAAWIAKPVGAETLAGFMTPGFACTALRPDALAPAFEDDVWSVRRFEAAEGEGVLAPRDAAGLAAVLSDLAAPLKAAGKPKVKFKTHRVTRAEGHYTTRAFLEAESHGENDGVQINADWELTWAYPDGDGGPPLLKTIRLLRHEEIDVRAAHGKLFVDHTASALGGLETYRDLVLRGVLHWVDRISRIDNVSLFGHAGIAVGDVDGDGLEDLYVCDEGGLPNRLYLQQPDGTLKDASAAAGVDWLERTYSALIVDLDNDGDQDLAVATYPRLLLAENDGAGKFKLRAKMAVAEEAYSLSAADYDGDGDLDLYACTYGGRGPGAAGEDQLRDEDAAVGVPVPYHDANNGAPNALLRNDGDFRFVDATEGSGLDTNNMRFSFAASWEDYDNDGDADLYVANDFGRNSLFRNDGGKFVDVAAEAGVEDIATGMSVSWGDYDRDGWIDLYVGNMYSSAGNRIAFQRNFGPGLTNEAVTHLQRTARGNTLFANQGDGTFRDVSDESGATMGRWAWSSNFADLNNDGWLDLVVANGFLTGDADAADL
ncbi:MAG: VCBS repeat-containing protein [bacterium]|nr:VCBS repeat-containing protein [bacterium]